MIRTIPKAIPLPIQYGRKNRRPPSALKGWDRIRLEHKFDTIKNLKHKAFIGILYLSACRISELLGTREYKNPITGLIRSQIKYEVLEGQSVILLQEVTTLKVRDSQSVRNIAIKYKGNEKLIGPFLEYIKSLEPESTVFSFSRKTGYNYVRRYLGLFPHYLRHLRLMEYATDYEFTDLELRSVTGWRNAQMSARYTEALNWKRTIRKTL